MITQLPNAPNNIAAFRATGQEVTQLDFDSVVMPVVKEVVEKTGELNFILVLDTPIKNFTVGAWMKDALVGLQNLTKWNRAAIVTDSEGIRKFTDIFSKLMIGEFRGFPKSNLKDAIDWVAGRQEPHK